MVMEVFLFSFILCIIGSNFSFLILSICMHELQLRNKIHRMGLGFVLKYCADESVILFDLNPVMYRLPTTFDLVVIDLAVRPWMFCVS